MQNTKQKASTKQKLTIAAIFGAMGPGLLAALSGNDAGGIATYSSAGASYGYKMLWMLPVMTVLLIVTQETAARCGCVTGKGLASLIRCLLYTSRAKSNKKLPANPSNVTTSANATTAVILSFRWERAF